MAGFQPTLYGRFWVTAEEVTEVRHYRLRTIGCFDENGGFVCVGKEHFINSVLGTVTMLNYLENSSLTCGQVSSGHTRHYKASYLEQTAGGCVGGGKLIDAYSSEARASSTRRTPLM